MSNVEGMYSACRELLCRTVYFKKRLSKAKPPFLRNSAVRCSGHLKPSCQEDSTGHWHKTMLRSIAKNKWAYLTARWMTAIPLVRLR